IRRECGGPYDVEFPGALCAAAGGGGGRYRRTGHERQSDDEGHSSDHWSFLPLSIHPRTSPICGVFSSDAVNLRSGRPTLWRGDAVRSVTEATLQRRSPSAPCGVVAFGIWAVQEDPDGFDGVGL